MLQSINIQLPDEIVNMLDELSECGDRSTVITVALQHYHKLVQTNDLREQIKVGAINRANRDQQLVEEW
jgi:CopG family transcriptional regulator / antitoxin EndoAI